jgi:hypothetical protein
MATRVQNRVGSVRFRLALLSLIAAAVLTLSAAASADASDPTLSIHLTLAGPVPAHTAITFGGGTSAAWVCLPASATATWPAGSVVVPPCTDGRPYGDRLVAPPGTRQSFFFSIAFCLDPACQSTTKPIWTWKGTAIMGQADRSVALTYTFGGPPNTSTLGAPADPSGRTNETPLVLAAVFGLGISLQRFRRRGLPLTR